MFTAEFLHAFLAILSVIIAIYLVIEELDEKPRNFRTNLFINNTKKVYGRKRQKWYSSFIR